MKEISKFQLIVLGVFILLGLVGVAVFALEKSSGQSQAASVSIWGILPASAVTPTLDALQTANKNTFSVAYTYVDPQSFQSKLVNAIATGQGPDAVLLSQDTLLSLQDLLYPIPYSNYSERSFLDTFAQAGQTYLTPVGADALPIAIDPLMMYWNQSILSNAGYAEQPKTWTDVLILAQKLTLKDANGNITQSTLDLGGWNNIPHAKDVLSALMLQGGVPIVSVDSTGKISPALDTVSNGISGAQEALRFYTQFADPSKNLYSWNNALPSADQMFVSGALALYFAPASEAATLRSRNPNLNFDVASIPQTGTTNVATFGDVYGFALLKSSLKLSSALSDIALITSATPAQAIVSALGMAPARKDLLSETPSDPNQAVFWQSAITADTWLDPDGQSTDDIFATMVQSVTSGASDVGTAVTAANSSLRTLLTPQ